MDLEFWIDHADSLFHQIFMVVMGGLYGIAYVLGTTYNVVNILVYYVLIPSSWIYLISRRTTIWLNAISGTLLLIFVLQPNIRESCNSLFRISVDFLNYVADIFGSNYIDISVYVCVVIVTLIYLIILPFTLPKKITKYMLYTLLVGAAMYLIFIFPNFKSILLNAIERYNIQY